MFGFVVVVTEFDRRIDFGQKWVDRPHDNNEAVLHKTEWERYCRHRGKNEKF